MNKLMVFKFLMIFFAATRSFGDSLPAQLQKAVSENQNADSLIQWESSPHHPSKIFGYWRGQWQSTVNNTKSRHQFCEALESLNALSLSVFEQELSNVENQQLLAPCKKKLMSRLEGFHQGQTKNTWSVELNNFKFPDNIQTRDTQNGYYAVSGDVKNKEVVITFDDGPSPYTDSILNSLNEVNAKAIFFMLGKNVRNNPERVRKVAAGGHAVASHTVNHPCLGDNRRCEQTNGKRFSFAEAVSEIRGGHQAIVDVLGWVDPFFRFPYGEFSEPLAKFLNANSVANFYWTIDSEDWRAQTNESLLNGLLNKIEKRGKGIVLFHDIQRKTAEIMPAFLRALYYRGYSVVLLRSSDETARNHSKLVKRPIP